MSWPMLNEKRFDGTPAGGFEYNKDITIVIDKVMNVKPFHFYGPNSRYVKTNQLQITFLY